MSADAVPDWPIHLIDRIDRFYTKIFGGIADEYLERMMEDGWQLRAMIESIRPMFSTIHWPKEEKINARAKFVGGLLGHTVAHYEALCDPRLWSHMCDLAEKLLKWSDVNCDEDEVLSKDENFFILAKPQFNAAITGAMRLASRQSVPEQIMFFDGYTKALRKGSVTMDGRGVAETPRTSAYQLIAACGPLFKDKWRSVHDVHRFLDFMLGKQRAGMVKRTEEICRSLRLRFRDPGRPPNDPLGLCDGAPRL